MAIVTDNADNARRILLASYWYPPAIGAAAERLGAFARHLPKHGWQTRVLTARRGSSTPETPGVQVRPIADPLVRSGRSFADYDPRSQPSRLRAFLRGWVFPDRFVAWQKAAFEAGRQWIAQDRVDVILASFPPASAAMLGLRLHQASGVPLVMDFRDRWIGPGGYEPTSRRIRRKHEQLERDVIAGSAAVIVVSQAMADAVVAEHKLDPARVWVIPNGYEPWEHDASATTEQGSGDDVERPFTLAHVGTVIARNRPDLFFASLASIKEDPLLRHMRIRFVGNLSRDYLAASGLTPLVETTGLLPREDARREMQAADALLLLTGQYVGTWGHNAKLFEYLQTSKPILCLEETPGSNDRHLLETVAPERSFFAPMDAPGEIEDQLTRLSAESPCSSQAGAASSSALSLYSRPSLVASLADRLTSLG